MRLRFHPNGRPAEVGIEGDDLRVPRHIARAIFRAHEHGRLTGDGGEVLIDGAPLQAPLDIARPTYAELLSDINQAPARLRPLLRILADHLLSEGEVEL